MSSDPKKLRGLPQVLEKSSEQPKDRWLKSQLRQLYDEVAAEPLPQDFLDLINQFDPGVKKEEKSA